ncbi:MAG TPA: GNAT family protein [Solirubrobacterales bacterium]|jgi:RimJ/RimL family protein N-acetyltransferase|nr:GNAT family protein [Solirubrobacterales bacterium]
MIEPGFDGPLTATLEGALVTLEPLAEEHRDGLWEAARPDEVWVWLATLNQSREYFDGWFDATLVTDAAGEWDPTETGAFAVRRNADGVLVGTSRYLNVRRFDRVVEIGWTWFNPSVWQTGVNVETKLLMFTNAFETLGCVRVELKTDARNERSRGAMIRLPARFEGIMRKHMIVPGVGQRDSAYFSVVDTEWPTVRDSLRGRLTAAARG